MYHIILLKFKQYTSGRFPVVVKNIKKIIYKKQKKKHMFKKQTKNNNKTKQTFKKNNTHTQTEQKGITNSEIV